MIFYFSGTGNSRWVAEEIARNTGDQALSIENLPQIPTLEGQARVGLVFPVYAWGVPERMLDFAGRVRGYGGFAFAVCTCGSEAGRAVKKLSAALHLDSGYSIVMPNNYVAGSDLDGESAIYAKLAAARTEILKISREIVQSQRVYRVNEGSMARLKSSLVCWGFNRFARTTKPFFTTDRCNGCGWCAQNCPAAAIALRDGRPVWKQTCDACMRCINGCPRSAIQYGSGTEKRGRYLLANYLPAEK